VTQIKNVSSQQFFTGGITMIFPKFSGREFLCRICCSSKQWSRLAYMPMPSLFFLFWIATRFGNKSCPKSLSFSELFELIKLFSGGFVSSTKRYVVKSVWLHYDMFLVGFNSPMCPTASLKSRQTKFKLPTLFH